MTVVISDPAQTRPRPAARPDPVATFNLMGVGVSAVNLGLARDTLLAAIETGRRGFVCVRDAHGLVRAQKDTGLRHAHNNAFLVTPDGMPLVWALKLAGFRKAGRVYGPDLMAEMFDAGRSAGVKHYLYGTTEENLALLSARLLQRFPGAQIVGSYAPPFRPLSDSEETEVTDRINAAGADIIWVGLSTPKQEHWMHKMRDRLQASMLIGVGAAFDFHAGNKPQAPQILQRSGMEWAFRLACEPRRLWRRYAVTIPCFLGLAFAQATGLRRFPIDDR